jgi:hypothetical protein
MSTSANLSALAPDCAAVAVATNPVRRPSPRQMAVAAAERASSIGDAPTLEAGAAPASSVPRAAA